MKPPKFRATRTIIALMLREMTATYGRSAGGYIWAILQPAGMIVMLSIAFSLMIRTPSLGTSFIMFYATGYLPYSFFGIISGKTAGALRYSRALLTYPTVTWIDAMLARLFLNVVTSAAVFCIVMTVIVLVVDSRTTLDLGAILIGTGICVLTGFGVGLCNAVLEGLWPVWTQLWSIVTRPLLIASGVLFIMEDIPPLAQTILWWNPLIHGTAMSRSGFFSTYQADFVSLVYCFGLALTLIALGLVFTQSTYKTVLER